jgi:hypothetical protein
MAPMAGNTPNDDDERATQERSDALNLEEAERLFAELFWPAERALRWIAFRDVTRIEDSLRSGTRYQGTSAEVPKDTDPLGTLLRAVQDGSLRALKDGKELPRESWATATGRNWSEDVRFLREAILGLWPALSNGLPQWQPEDPSLQGVEFGRDRQREEQRRIRQIERFNACQRRARRWINFAEIADWCSELGGSVTPNETDRASAFVKLQRDFMEGDFEGKDVSRVLYLSPETSMTRMTQESMQRIIDTCDAEVVQKVYLGRCWLQRKLFERWLAKHHLPPSPPRFDPTAKSAKFPLDLDAYDGRAASKASDRALRSPRTPGCKPVKLNQVKEAMRRDIREGRQTAEGLRTMLQKNLASDYRVSRETAEKARILVLSEFVEK